MLTPEEKSYFVSSNERVYDDIMWSRAFSIGPRNIINILNVIKRTKELRMHEILIKGAWNHIRALYFWNLLLNPVRRVLFLTALGFCFLFLCLIAVLFCSFFLFFDLLELEYFLFHKMLSEVFYYLPIKVFFQSISFFWLTIIIENLKRFRNQPFKFFKLYVVKKITFFSLINTH